MGLEEATDGEVLLNGKEIGHLPVRKRAPQLIGSLQIVFQNPFETLNPSHSVGSQIARVLKKFGVARSRDEVQERVFELLDLVKLPRAFAFRKPRQLSGGQKQRIGIARAFGGDAAVVVADEPVSALDVSVQAAVTGLLTDIQRQKRTTLLFISHDLSVVRYLADRVVVMYLGHIMEQGTTDADLLAALSSLYGGAAVGGADRRHDGAQEAHRAQGRAALADEPAARLPLPDALPAQDRRDLRNRDAAGQGAGARPQDHVPSARRGAARHGAGHRIRRSQRDSSMKSHYRAVVIGGGVVGCSVLYHLAKAGWTRRRADRARRS